MIIWEAMSGLHVSGRPTSLRGIGQLAELDFDVIVTVDTQSLPPGIGARQLHFPMTDGKRIPANLYQAAHPVLECLQDGGRALVTCRSGRNRSALVAALVRNALTQDTGPVILADFDARRRGVLHNQAFRSWVTRL